MSIVRRQIQHVTVQAPFLRDSEITQDAQRRAFYQAASACAEICQRRCPNLAAKIRRMSQSAAQPPRLLAHSSPSNHPAARGNESKMFE